MSALRTPHSVLRTPKSYGQVEDAQRPRTLSGIVPDFRRVNSVVQKVFQHKVFSVSFPLNDDLIFLSFPPSFQLISIQGDYKKIIQYSIIQYSIPSMEWNGMEWNGMEWNGMEWNGMEWNGMEWNGMEWNGMEWNGMEWNGMEWNGMEWNGMEWNGMEWNKTLFIHASLIIRRCFS